MPEWSDYWNAVLTETTTRNPSFEYDEYYRSGRASKDWPNKEDEQWWAKHGPQFVKSWEQWRKHCGLTFWEFADEETGELSPGIEIPTWAVKYVTEEREDNLVHVREELIVHSVIDRVMVNPSGDLYIVDLKSGSYTPPWPLQLILNNLTLYYTHGVRAKWGGYWKARKGGIEPHWFDLSIYDDDWVWDLVAKAKAIRDQQLFIPNPNNLCNSACGVRAYCKAMGGTTPYFLVNDATLSQRKDEQGE